MNDTIRQKINQERIQSPERVQTTPGTRRGGGGSEPRIAYAKVAAGTGNTIACYLDTDETGEEITVTCLMCRASNLNLAAPLLQNGDPITVQKIGSTWYSVMTFSGVEDE